MSQNTLIRIIITVVCAIGASILLDTREFYGALLVVAAGIACPGD